MMPNDILVNKAHHRVYKILTTDSDEVVWRRYVASIGPVTTREGRVALPYIKQDLIVAVKAARKIGTPFIRWQEDDYNGYGVVSEETMNAETDDDFEEEEDGTVDRLFLH